MVAAGALWETAAVAFGQQSGMPASARQVQELLALLHDAGHADFRDARGPMGFTQRQAAGKFTRDEATAFINSLQEDSVEPPPATPAVARRPAAVRTPPPAAAAPRPVSPSLRRVAAEDLAAELRRRGWVVAEP